MICYIKGEILDLNLGKISILTQGGVGYELGISENNYAEIVDKNLKQIELFVYHYITDNSQALYGFLSLEEKQVFEELIKISGVGGKVALLILSLGINTLSNAILNEDKKVIESVKGIGKKMAEKIILELKDKDFIKKAFVEDKQVKKEQKTQLHLDVDIIENIKTTLVNMGYNSKDIVKTLERLPEGYEKLDEILPWVIREMG